MTDLQIRTINPVMTQIATASSPDNEPEEQRISLLKLAPGDWRMRNGHIARLEKQVNLHYADPRTGGPRSYPIWRGECVNCRTPMTWNINGCYAAAGKHRNDIIG